MVCIVLAIPCLFFMAHNSKKKKEAELEAENLRIEALAKQERIEKTKACIEELLQEQAIADWIYESYTENQLEKLSVAAEDSVLAASEIYESLGESIYVLKDRYAGYLEDEETAKQQNIYFKDDKGTESLTISIAGDLCLAEDGFVLDHYDTVNDLTKCISPEILDTLNQSDLFYVNHEYCISDRGTPLNG